MSLYPSFARPNSLAQASELLAGLSGGIVIIAGGQEIMPHINHGAMQPDIYIDIGGLKELRGISEADGMVSECAMSSLNSLKKTALIASKQSARARTYVHR